MQLCSRKRTKLQTIDQHKATYVASNSVCNTIVNVWLLTIGSLKCVPY